MQVADRLEAPGRRTDESLVEPLLPRLVKEKQDPRFENIGAHIQVLQNKKNKFLVNHLSAFAELFKIRYHLAVLTSSSLDFSRVSCGINLMPKRVLIHSENSTSVPMRSVYIAWCKAMRI